MIKFIRINISILYYLKKQKNYTLGLVKYAILGLAQQVFVSKYLINLPSEKDLKMIIDNEKEKW
ncbi:hypothetical protein [Limnovirga soli]|uniref:Uncharacterized protein n=1 Tax=Limnovirga soli TaxID=2656915 RepID=A0A8J8JVR2_9BACT|nr:hypothetical protein [Limnovirga soli]NNV57635.1 hypothetical protein [Limnovirga soli]